MTTARDVIGNALDVSLDDVRAALIAETGRHWFPRPSIIQNEVWGLHAILADIHHPDRPVFVTLQPTILPPEATGYDVEVLRIDGGADHHQLDTLVEVVAWLRQRALGFDALGPDPWAAALLLERGGHRHLASWLEELVFWRATGPADAEAATRVSGLDQRVKLLDEGMQAAAAYVDAVLPEVLMACRDLDENTVNRYGTLAAGFQRLRRVADTMRRSDAERRAPQRGGPAAAR